MKYTKIFLEKTVEVWQPYSTKPLSLDNAREITDNMTALFNFLISNETGTESKNRNSNKQNNKKRKDKNTNEKSK